MALQNTKGEIVEELGDLLVEAGMQNVLPLPKARVPVVKFVVGENGTKVGSISQPQEELLSPLLPIPLLVRVLLVHGAMIRQSAAIFYAVEGV